MFSKILALFSPLLAQASHPQAKSPYISRSSSKTHLLPCYLQQENVGTMKIYFQKVISLPELGHCPPHQLTVPRSPGRAKKSFKKTEEENTRKLTKQPCREVERMEVLSAGRETLSPLQEQGDACGVRLGTCGISHW